MIGNAVEFQRYCIDAKEKAQKKQTQQQADAMKKAFSAALKENQSQASQMEAPSGNKYCSSCCSCPLCNVFRLRLFYW